MRKLIRQAVQAIGIGRFRPVKVHKVDVVISASDPEIVISRHKRKRALTVDDVLAGDFPRLPRLPDIDRCKVDLR